MNAIKIRTTLSLLKVNHEPVGWIIVMVDMN
jgi:hypothetical protein